MLTNVVHACRDRHSFMVVGQRTRQEVLPGSRCNMDVRLHKSAIFKEFTNAVRDQPPDVIKVMLE